MLEHELKNRIVSTISQYKHKCDKLEDEISVLKSAIYQLSLLPNGIYVGVDRQMHNLQVNLQENQDSNKIKKSVERLVNAMSDLQKKKEENKTSISDFIKTGTKLLGKMVVSVQDQKTFEYAKKSIQAQTNEQALLSQFINLLEDSVNWVKEQMIFCQKNHFQLIQKKELPQITVDSQINARLNQIVQQLLIPDAFAVKFEELKSNLAQQLTIETLNKVIDSLTDLVIEAFNLEHYKFKEFLTSFVTYLQEFKSYLEVSTNNNLQTKGDTQQLKGELQDNIHTIKAHMEQAKTIGELTYKIESNLDLMTD
jgi:diguanylate cyclase